MLCFGCNYEVNDSKELGIQVTQFQSIIMTIYMIVFLILKKLNKRIKKNMKRKGREIRLEDITLQIYPEDENEDIHEGK